MERGAGREDGSDEEEGREEEGGEGGGERGAYNWGESDEVHVEGDAQPQRKRKVPAAAT